MSNSGVELNPYGKKIKEVREDQHLTLEYMAEELGMSGAKTYQRYETGESKLTLELLEAIAHIFKLSLAEMLNFRRGLVFNQSQHANTFGPGSSSYETHTKLVESQHARIKHLEEEVLFLRGQLSRARET